MFFGSIARVLLILTNEVLMYQLIPIENRFQRQKEDLITKEMEQLCLLNQKPNQRADV